MNSPTESRHIGPYEIEREIGAGGMGTVYLAKHTETGERAAVKVLPASLAREEGFVARFAREVDALKRLSSPHVVQLRDSGHEGDTYYYVMEFIEGETLTNRLRSIKRMPWTDVVEVSMQICVALKAAHDAGIIHRDLKPSNLMLTTDNMVKLTDFGVAQVFAGTRLTATGGIIGTAEYMSPEQAQGKRADKRSDLYSLGAVMYAMLTGRPPFSGKTTLEVIQKHKYGQFDKPSRYVDDIPHWLEEIVCKLLEKDPENRYPDAFVLQRRLQEVLTKVSLSVQEKTQVLAGSNASSATIVDHADAGPGPATLMRDLVRAELESQELGSPLSNFLNSTYFLVAALVLVILGGVWWFSSSQLSPEEMVARAEVILAGEPSSAWYNARDEYLVPALAAAPELRDRIQPLLHQVDDYEFIESLDKPTHRGIPRPPRDELGRQIQRASLYQQLGEIDKARAILSAVQHLTEEAPDAKHAAVHEFVTRQLEEFPITAENAKEFSFLEHALERAAAFQAEGRPRDAERIWTSILELYATDPAAADYVKQARSHLDQPVTARPGP